MELYVLSTNRSVADRLMNVLAGGALLQAMSLGDPTPREFNSVKLDVQNSTVTSRNCSLVACRVNFLALHVSCIAQA